MTKEKKTPVECEQTSMFELEGEIDTPVIDANVKIKINRKSKCQNPK